MATAFAIVDGMKDAILRTLPRVLRSTRSARNGRPLSRTCRASNSKLSGKILAPGCLCIPQHINVLEIKVDLYIHRLGLLLNALRPFCSRLMISSSNVSSSPMHQWKAVMVLPQSPHLRVLELGDTHGVKGMFVSPVSARPLSRDTSSLDAIYLSRRGNAPSSHLNSTRLLFCRGICRRSVGHSCWVYLAPLSM